jgi:hypothetical protein
VSQARENQRSAGGSLIVIASIALRKGLINFNCDAMSGYPVSTSSSPLAKALRWTLIQTNVVQVAGQDRSDKTEHLQLRNWSGLQSHP